MRTFRLLKMAVAGLTLSGVSALGCSWNYTVESGDTLGGIAQAHMGSILKTSQILQLNNAALRANPHKLAIGQVIVMPCMQESIDTVDWSVMPTPEDLEAIKKLAGVSLQILDIRSVKAIAKAGVIPGAVHVPYTAFRGPKDNPGQPPSAEKLADLIGGAGLRLDQPIIVIHSKPSAMDTGRAAMVYWILKSAGARHLGILRGGHKAWVDAGLPVVETAAVARPYTLEVEFSQQWRADVVDVYGLSTGQIEGYLLDARPHKVVAKLSKAGEAVATTLFGAQNAPVGELMGNILDVDPAEGVAEVVAYLKRNNVDWNKGHVISFCQSGELAALNWFYSSELAGLRNFKLFPESAKGWASMGGKLFALGAEAS